jgi:cysteine desulfurase
MSQTIYLDANATTPLLPEVVEAMRPFWIESFGNASSIHQRGQRTRSAVDEAREQVAALVECRASEIVFTSGGTESDNMALFGLLQPGDHCVTTSIEHHAVLHSAEALAERGVEVTFVAPTTDGRIEPAAVQEAMRAKTKLVSVMLANNETGVLNPVAEIAAIAHAGGALLHTDAVQGCGKMPVRVAELGCDLLSLSGHKMHGPQGTGALYVRKGLQLRPLLYGGAHERQRRAGTENVAGLVGLGRAAVLTQEFLAGGGSAEMAALRDRIEAALLGIHGTSVNGGGAPRVPNTTNLRFEDVDADALLIALDLQGVAVSAGSACSSGSTEPSHVLLAMGLSQEEAKSSLRISISRLNTQDEMDRAAQIIATAVDRLRKAAF